MAATIRGPGGRPLRSRLLSMVPVVDQGALERFRESRFTTAGTAEKASLSYRPYPREAITAPGFAPRERQFLPPGRKEAAAAAGRLAAALANHLNYHAFISTAAWPSPC